MVAVVGHCEQLVSVLEDPRYKGKEEEGFFLMEVEEAIKLYW